MHQKQHHQNLFSPTQLAGITTSSLHCYWLLPGHLGPANSLGTMPTLPLHVLPLDEAKQLVSAVKFYFFDSTPSKLCMQTVLVTSLLQSAKTTTPWHPQIPPQTWNSIFHNQPTYSKQTLALHHLLVSQLKTPQRDFFPVWFQQAPSLYASSQACDNSTLNNSFLLARLNNSSHHYWRWFFILGVILKSFCQHCR